MIIGSGDGNILCFNLESGECLYGYGVDQKGAVHCIGINVSKMVKFIRYGTNFLGMYSCKITLLL